METLIFNPTLAYKFNDNLSVGVGVSYIHSSLELDLTYLLDLTAIPPLGAYDVPVTAENTTGTAWAVNAGALYKGEKFSLGFNWRGGFTIDYDGDLDLDMSNVPIALPENGTVVAPFSFPHVMGIGAAFNLSDQVILTADVHYVLWSAFDVITVEADVPGLPIALDFPPIDENFEDSFLFRIGMQYQMNENFALRGGFLYDQTPQPVASMDPMLPDSDRWALTAGFGYNIGGFAIDVAYQFEPFKDRTSPNRSLAGYQVGPLNLGEGTYSTTAHLFGISFRYVF
jgi:long-chain fatty acid transport protein